VSDTGYATLADAIDDLTRRGFTEHFVVTGSGLCAIGSGRTFRADELAIEEYHRFEGVSDPDDLAIVYAIESRGGARGTLVDAFGVYASPVVGAFLQGIPMHRATV
jgi:hypothetical protein